MTPDFPPPDDDTLLAAGRRALHELPDAPEWMILRAEALDSPRARPQAALAPDLLRRVQALLSVDSRAGAVPVLRGAAGTRQLLFSAGEHDVDLRLVPAGDAWAIEGQVLGPEEAGQVHLAGADGGVLRVQPLDDMGSFRIDDLPAGRYRLELRFAASAVELPPLDLGAAAVDG